MHVTENISMSEPIRRLFWKYTIPTLAAVVINGLYVVVDGIFIGQFIGADGLAAINLIWPLYGCVLGFGGMIGTAGAALFSIEKGKGDIKMARRYLGNSMLLLGVAAVFIYILLRLFSEQALTLQLSDNETVLHFGMDYISILAPMSFWTLCATAFPLLIRNDNHPRLATKLMVVGALCNIVGDYVLIAHAGWGMKGAAAASVGAQAVISIIGFRHFFSRRANMRLQLKDLRLSLFASYKTLVLGFSSFFMYVYFSFLAALYNYMFARYGSAVTVAAYALVGYYAGLYYMFSEGVTSGVQPIISFNYGANRYYNIRRTLGMAVRVILISAVVFLGIVYAFPNLLINIVNRDDPALHEASLLGLRLHMITCYLEAFILLATVYFQSVDSARKATLISLVNLFIQVPFVIILPMYWGVAGIWLAYPVANVPLSIYVFFALVRDLRQKTGNLKIRHKAGMLKREEAV